MRFEHILQVYWSKGFFFGGKLFYTNSLDFKNFFKQQLYGLSSKFKQLLIKRLEITTFYVHYSNLYYLLDYSSIFFKKITKTINIILSQINNVNLNLKELNKINILRQYLVKSYQGYCHAIGKPVRGQRTWSNAWNSFKCNNVLRNFVNKIKHINSLSNKNKTLKIDYKVIKKKYSQQSSHNKSKQTIKPKTLSTWY